MSMIGNIDEYSRADTQWEITQSVDVCHGSDLLEWKGHRLKQTGGVTFSPNQKCIV